MDLENLKNVPSDFWNDLNNNSIAPSDPGDTTFI